MRSATGGVTAAGPIQTGTVDLPGLGSAKSTSHAGNGNEPKWRNN